MQVQNKYVRYRREVEATRGNEEKADPIKPATQSLPPPAETLPPVTLPKPPLAEIEKPKPITDQPLPGGGVRKLDYKGPLSARELDRVERLYSLYKEAESKSQVNWKVLAGVHYRESALGLNPKARGNEFQFDGANKGRATGNLLLDAIEAGKLLQEKASSGLYSAKAKKFLVPPTDRLRAHQTDEENVRTAVFLYNGPVYRKKAAPGAPPYDRSPYVLNQLDNQHRNMDLYLGNNANPRWAADRRLGVIPFVRELGKAFVEE